VTAGVSRNTSGTGCWPMTQTTTAKASSWTGSSSRRVASADAPPSTESRRRMMRQASFKQSRLCLEVTKRKRDKITRKRLCEFATFAVCLVDDTRLQICVIVDFVV